MQAKGVPKSLLDMSVHFGCLHVSMTSVWVKWGQTADTARKEEKDSAEHGVGFTERLESPDDGFSLLDEDALSKLDQKTGLGGVYDADSAAVAQKMKG